MSNGPAVPSLYPATFKVGTAAGTVVAKLISKDPENDAVTFTLSGTDAGLFEVSGTDLKVKTGGAALASGSKDIIVTATDRSGAAGSQSTSSAAITLTESCVAHTTMTCCSVVDLRHFVLTYCFPC